MCMNFEQGKYYLGMVDFDHEDLKSQYAAIWLVDLPRGAEIPLLCLGKKPADGEILFEEQSTGFLYLLRKCWLKNLREVE